MKEMYDLLNELKEKRKISMVFFISLIALSSFMPVLITIDSTSVILLISILILSMIMLVIGIVGLVTSMIKYSKNKENTILYNYITKNEIPKYTCASYKEFSLNFKENIKDKYQSNLSYNVRKGLFLKSSTEYAGQIEFGVMVSSGNSTSFLKLINGYMINYKVNSNLNFAYTKCKNAKCVAIRKYDKITKDKEELLLVAKDSNKTNQIRAIINSINFKYQKTPYVINIKNNYVTFVLEHEELFQLNEAYTAFDYQDRIREIEQLLDDMKNTINEALNNIQ